MEQRPWMTARPWRRVGGGLDVSRAGGRRWSQSCKLIK